MLILFLPKLFCINISVITFFFFLMSMSTCSLLSSARMAKLPPMATWSLYPTQKRRIVNQGSSGNRASILFRFLVVPYTRLLNTLFLVICMLNRICGTENHLLQYERDKCRKLESQVYAPNLTNKFKLCCAC